MLPDPDAKAETADTTAKASSVPKQFKDTSADIDLRAALHNFRCCQMERLFSPPLLRTLGPALIMGDNVVQRLIDCARVHKGRDQQDLWRETKWVRVVELGEEVLALLHR